ncbi:hypothetical protein ER308_13115 [Egibacter rhizosphaerae]|uniref:Pyruvate carboxyltransferase domain-containing protein n=1 Tax=Egibacter rhizosphaerae TaxID=1670831 RepID=A0A411YGT6_9ACTN|nr:hypothetical protein [Egibacter rhizosphaerae]QBI20413.1 hypothetical protein ER308_13115 [Egibacter rhizosphaerae]
MITALQPGATNPMVDRAQFYTSPLNAQVLGDAVGRRIGIYDTTLRDGEQSVGVVFDPEDKVRIAHALDRLGVPRIEASFPRVSPRDEEAIRLLVQEDLDAQLWGFGRAVPADIELLAGLGLPATIIEAPVSHTKLAAYGVEPEKMLERIRTAVQAGVESGMRVCFFGVDGSRAHMDHLRASYEAALEGGAEEIAVVDTIGVLAPEAVRHLVGSVRGWVGPDIPIHWHGHNDFGLATAGAVAAVDGGANWIQATINGIGERAGNANIAEIALAFEGLYEHQTGLRLDRLRETSQLVAELAGHGYEPWKSVVGDNLFIRESGAVAMQFHEPEAVEPYAADLVGAERKIVLGKKSGAVSLDIKAEELGLDLDGLDQMALLQEVKRLSEDHRRTITDAEFVELVKRAQNG